MTIQQFNRAQRIRSRIYELKVMLAGMKRNEYTAKIDNCEIPKDSKEVIIALCQKEIDELEQEFNNL